MLVDKFFFILSYILHHFFQPLLKNGSNNMSIMKAQFYQMFSFSHPLLRITSNLTSNVFYLIYSIDLCDLDYFQPNLSLKNCSPSLKALFRLVLFESLNIE